MAESKVKPLLMEDDKLILPLDIMINILKRLPVKYLLRFKCVCKDWNNLFKTSFFIKQHLHHSNHHRGSSLILQSYCFNHPDDYMQFNLLHSNKKTLTPMNAPSIYLRPFFRRCRIIGSSNGIVCLQLTIDNSIFLWNPATREVQQVPNNHAMNNNFGKFCHVGFGFSTSLNDFKIVKIHHPISSRRVEIYSLSTGSWKELTEFSNLQSLVFGNRFTVTDEAMYWFAYKENGNGDPFINNSSRFIVSFNMAKEVFTLIRMPTSNFLVNNELITYENKLALLSRIEVCVMEDEEEATSSGGSGQGWNKEFIGCPCLHGLYLMTIWRNEAVFRRILHIPGTKPKLYIYILNLTTFKFKKFLIGPECGYVAGSFNYVESLVSIDPLTMFG